MVLFFSIFVILRVILYCHIVYNKEKDLKGLLTTFALICICVYEPNIAVGEIHSLAINQNNSQTEALPQEVTTDSTVSDSLSIPAATIDTTLLIENEEALRGYIEDMNMYYIRKIIEEYETIDQAIRQDSLPILLELLALNSKKRNILEKDTSIISLLIEKKVNLNAVNGKGETAFSIIANQLYNHIARPSIIHFAKEFIRNGVSPNTIDTKSDIILYKFMPYMDMELFSYAIANGAKLNAPNSKGENLYLLTTKYMPLEALNMLIDSVDNINIADNNGANALEYALIRAKLNGSTAAEKAKETSQIISYLIDKGVKVAEGEKLSTIGFIFQNYLAFSEDLPLLLTKMIDAGANVNQAMQGRTPLQLLFSNYMSLVFKYPTLVDLLISKGADINAVYKEQTVLDMIKVPPMRDDISESEKAKLGNRIKEYNKVIELLKNKGAKSYSEL